jgi:hypothetical protein
MNTPNLTEPPTKTSTPTPPPQPGGFLGFNSGHPRNGKIAKLPREQRDRLNQMLDNGATHADIIAHFQLLDIHLNGANISHWKSGGYQDWLLQQELLASFAAESEWAGDLGQSGDDTVLHQGVIRLAVVQIFQALKHQQLRDDPQNYTRMLNALARLTREALCLRKHVESSAAAARTDSVQELDAKRQLSDSERAAIVRHVDQAFGLPILSEEAGATPPHPAPQDPAAVPLTPAPPLPATSPEPADSPAQEPDDSALRADREAPKACRSEPETTIAEIKVLDAITAPVPADCPSCGDPLPPLLPTGERSQSHCRNCGTYIADLTPTKEHSAAA